MWLWYFFVAAYFSLPACPPQANGKSCSEWCAKIEKSLNAVVSYSDASNACSCYDADFETILHECEPSPEPEETEPTCTGTTCTDRYPKQEPSALERYFLYDVKVGEGFNLQREVFARAAWVVYRLNERLDATCGTGPAKTPRCARWTVVLPPWCRLAHWGRESGPHAWSRFFDEGALRQAVPVMEFEEYAAKHGQEVELAVNYASDGKPGTGPNGNGEFWGWAPVSECGARTLPRVNGGSDGAIVYSGHCPGGLVAREEMCAILRSPFPRAIVDMLSGAGATSVFVKAYDYLLSPDNGELDGARLRESLLFSGALRDEADKFVESIPSPFVSAHVRRNDFLRVRKETTPDLSTVASKLKAVMAEHKAAAIFVATDATDDEVAASKKDVPQLYLFPRTSRKHPADQGIIETWIAARAAFFLGTQESRFTSSIQLERGFLGHPKDANEEFCREYATGEEKKCQPPAYRHAAPAQSRADYFDREA